MLKLFQLPNWGVKFGVFMMVRNPNEIRVFGLEIWYGITPKTHTNTKRTNHLDLWG
ncbi:hypothetical protein RchiOBHm_Chr5g0025561 [Rosa chinensis]|uniref:Uncharacterized protein n=1 Tax=Rosa chinensis TaxID=74649 RepID=A0A2P6Q8L2_ROSCH|nr:hypothetical protein RchiOBHm_Chr5g0025561 [Rosa chinensis]